MVMPEHKLKRDDVSWTPLTHFQANPMNFHLKLVTQDKTKVHQFKLEFKASSFDTLVLHPQRSSHKQYLLGGDGFCFFLFWRHNHDRLKRNYGYLLASQLGKFRYICIYRIMPQLYMYCFIFIYIYIYIYIYLTERDLF